MFHFPRFAPGLAAAVAGLAGWVAPFGDPRFRRLLSARLGLSQIGTSFIASWRPGIRRVRLIA